MASLDEWKELVRRRSPNESVGTCLMTWIETRPTAGGQRRTAAAAIACSLQSLGPSLTRKTSQKKLTAAIIDVRTQIYRFYTKRTAIIYFANVRKAVLYLADRGHLSIPTNLPSIRLSVEERAALLGTEAAADSGPNPFDISQTGVAQTQWETITRCAPTQEIARRVEEHVRSKNIEKHHRGHAAQIMSLLFARSARWHEDPALIHRTLKTYRDNLLKRLSRHSAYNQFSNVIKLFTVLAEHQLIPASTVLPRNLKRPKSALFQRENNPTLGSFNVYDHEGVGVTQSTAAYIDAFHKDVSKHSDAVLSAARQVVHRAYSTYSEGMTLVAQSDFATFTDPSSPLPQPSNHPRWRKWIYALSANCPNRIGNTIAYLRTMAGGAYSLALLQAVGCTTRLYEIEGYLGMTSETMSAMQAIIVDECGINPYSLYSLKVSDAGRLGQLVLESDDGSVRMNAVKRRKNALQRRVIAGEQIPLSDVPVAGITASTCLKMALEMSATQRSFYGTEHLWATYTREKDSPTLVPESFQLHFKAFTNTHTPAFVSMAAPTLMKLRISRALMIYIESKGNVLAVSDYLGNTVRTALDQYIPGFLQEAIYRKKIAGFQQVLMVLSTADHTCPEESLNLSLEQYRLLLRSIFSNADLSGPLVSALTRYDRDNDANSYYFILSEYNLALALRYATHGDDSELVSLCSIAIAKAAAGPVHVKQMLRRARALEQS